MANVLNRTTLVYLLSVNTPDYSDVDWVINPDLSAVVGVPQYYWKLTGDVVSEMDAGEKAVVDKEREISGAANIIGYTTVKAKGLTAPPASPGVDDRYAVGVGATDEWTGFDNLIAVWNGDKWVPEKIQLGTTVLVEDDNTHQVQSDKGDLEILSADGGIFGSSGSYSESLKEESTSSTDYVQRHKMETAKIPAGTYRIAWNFVQSTGNVLIAVGHRIQIDDNAIVLLDETPLLLSTKTYNEFSGYAQVALEAGVHVVSLDHRTDNGVGASSTVKNSRLELWRVL